MNRALRGMNTDLHLTVRLDEENPERRAAAESALDRCETWLAEFERTCSRFLPDSELVALNAAAGTEYHASELLFAVVERALEAAAETGGLFDPTVLAALHAAGYTRSFDEIGHREIEPGTTTSANTSASALALPRRVFGVQPGYKSGPLGWPGDVWRGGRWREIRLDRERRTITLPEGAGLDLGGIAKGWAADELARQFLAKFPAYLVDLGGDLRVQAGPEPGQPWIIGVADPRQVAAGQDLGAGTNPDPVAEGPTYLAGIPLAEGGIATSGDARRWWLRRGSRQHHLIDPRTGRPALPPEETGTQGRVLAWTALTRTAAEADVLAKVAYLRGYPEGLRSLARGTDSAGLCIFASGQLATTANLEEYLHAHSVSPA